jgi:hypothetical protein
MDANKRRNHAIKIGDIIVPISFPNAGGNAQQILVIVNKKNDLTAIFLSSTSGLLIRKLKAFLKEKNLVLDIW